ncbi:MAG: GAF domain-containing protein [Candidatus Rokubacteria bacterium]|nr:GAF domain-containing protein [Candidatus Rokubacteria bacterium]
MKIGRVFPDLLTPLSTAASVEEGLRRTLARLVGLTGASAGALLFTPPREAPIVVTAGARRVPAALGRWLAAAARAPLRGVRLERAAAPGAPRGRAATLLRVALGAPGRPVGALVLVGPPRALGRGALAAGFPRELGVAIEQVWRLHRRALRMSVLNEITQLLVSSDSLDGVFRAFVDSAAKLVGFDSIGVALLDAERGEFELVDVVARGLPLGARRDARMPVADTLLQQVVATGTPVRVDDVAAERVPAASRQALAARGWRAVALVPLVAGGGAFGAVTVAAARPAAFDDTDVEVIAELARPLALAIEQRRLLDEGRRRADELAALYATSQLITARLDVASVLDRISRSVAALIGSTGCGIGLLDAERTRIVHVAAHGFRSEEWRKLSMPVGEGIMGRAASLGAAIRVHDVRTDPRSARRDVDEREGIRSMLSVPLKEGGAVIGVISAFSTRPGVFTTHHQRVLEAFGEQAGIAIHNAQLFEESVHRARETRALLEAGRAVTASLDVDRTIHVILDAARGVLGADSCGLATLDPATNELVSVASLDLPTDMATQIRLKVGEGIGGLAVSERRPVQSRDLHDDPRVRYPQLPRAAGFRSMLAVPLRVGDRAIGAISVFRRDVHEFSAAEEELLLALADQAAIALEHARLYTAQEGMVAERTRELDSQKRFVEVVLETLPLGVFVLDAGLGVVRANREGARVLACDAGARCSFPGLLPADTAEPVRAFLREAFATRRVGSTEEEIVVAGEAKMFRFTVAPFESAADTVTHAVLLVEDITRAKRLERQMLLTERLTVAGRLAAGVAHELNNPLATIAGCAEALRERLREAADAGRAALADFPNYLGLIEEEAYRCKEITGSLLQFVREPGSRRAPTDLNGLVQKAVELLAHQSRFAESRFVTELDAALPPATVNEGQLRQVFLGLASNGLEAMDGRGTLTLRSRVRRGEIEVEFEDAGPGIPDENLPRVFDPFFTTKPPGQGTGLGLAIAQGIVADHGGRIEVTSRPGKGSVFRVVLPQ